jgi:hypothetical protein
LLLTLLTTGEIFYKKVGWSSQWNGGRGAFFLISLVFGAITSLMAYCCLIPVILISQGDFSLTCDCCEGEESHHQEEGVWTTSTPVVRMDTQEDDGENNARRRVNQDNAENRDIEILKVKRYKKERSLLLNKDLSPTMAEKEEMDKHRNASDNHLGKARNLNAVLINESFQTPEEIPLNEIDEVIKLSRNFKKQKSSNKFFTHRRKKAPKLSGCSGHYRCCLPAQQHWLMVGMMLEMLLAQWFYYGLFFRSFSFSWRRN